MTPTIDLLTPLGSPTPLVEVDGIFTKIEMVNPTGSIKDRIVWYILNRSQQIGLLKPGMKIVEATSGNTGIALAYYGRQLGYQVVIVMPEHMTQERKDIIRSFGAELVLCSQKGSFAEAALIRDEMAGKAPHVFNPDQFSNPLNVECHQVTTGRELLDQLGRPIDAFVAGVGTGGTLIGVAAALRKVQPTWIAAVEPSESAVMSGCPPASSHSIYGIGDGFIPAIAGDGNGGISDEIDEVIQISSQEAIEAAKYLAREHRIHAGISSGANFLAAQKLRERYETVATVFADGARKYLSEGLVLCEQSGCQFADHCAHCVVGRGL